ncbi:MAG: hypothetical protein C0403_07615 [Desulfobacterium sp.]|nr:hypothetical protein [Desulfobacterium sp.]
MVMLNKSRACRVSFLNPTYIPKDILEYAFMSHFPSLAALTNKCMVFVCLLFKVCIWQEYFNNGIMDLFFMVAFGN